MDEIKTKSVIKNLVESNPFEKVPLIDLERIFIRKEKFSLKAVASQNGFSSISAMIKSWSGFKVTGTGLSTNVEFCRTAATESSENGICRSPARDLHTYINRVEKRVPPCEAISDLANKMPIVLLHCINPYRFWFCEKQEHRELEELMKTMGIYYAKQEMQLKIGPLHLQPGLHVAVKRQNSWYRGKIVKRIEPAQARLFFVDFGITEDVLNDDRVRYLREDFSRMPATAHRGILSFIRPKKGLWTSDSISFMKKRCGQQLEAKIHRLDESSQSYYLSIKRTAEQQQFSDSLVTMGACFMDLSFLERDSIPYDKDFSYYEDGLHFDTTDHDDWLPKTPKMSGDVNSRLHIQGPNKVGKNGHNSNTTPVTEPPTEALHRMRIFVQDKKFRLEMPEKSSVNNNCLQPLKVPPIPKTGTVASTSPPSIEPKRSVEVMKPSMIRCEPSTSVQEKKELPISNKRTGLPKSRPLGVQDLTQLDIGSKTHVIVHEVHDVNDFYFFFKENLIKSLEFQEYFEATRVPNQNFAVGTGVVIFHDENYCRGRITEVMGDELLFKILLIDFGMIDIRSKEEVFKLDDEFWLNPAAAHHGQLANIPEHAYIKTAEDLKNRTLHRTTSAQIVRIVGTKVELRLLN